MQNLVLAVQNTVDLRNMGAASSLVSFLRSLGGTIGVTVLGVVLSGRVAELLGGSAAAAAGLSDLESLSPLQAEALRAAYGDGIGLVFGIAAIASLVSLVAVLLIKEVPLRTTIDRQPTPRPHPAACPTPARTALSTHLLRECRSSGGTGLRGRGRGRGSWLSPSSGAGSGRRRGPRGPPPRPAASRAPCAPGRRPG